MPQLPDDVLFDFDKNELPDWDAELSLRLLRDHPDLYRNHLAIARGLEGWANRSSTGGSAKPDWAAGHEEALRRVARDLRYGNMLPGEPLYESWTDPLGVKR